MESSSKPSQVATQVVRWLLEEMKSGEFRYAERLPPETKLAEKLGVSRTAVRDGMAILEREGFVGRKQGLGTIIYRNVLEVKTRIDLEKEFLDIIAEAGFTPGTNYTTVRYAKADNADAAQWKIPVGEPLIHITRLITADGVPAIYCEDSFPVKLIREDGYDESDLQKPIFSFFRKYCGTDVFMDLTEIHAVNADERLAAELQVPQGAALLHLNERGFDFCGNLLLCSQEYYREGVLTHTILRKKIE